LVTVATQCQIAADQRTRDAFMLVRADGAQLAHIAELIDAGELRVFVDQYFSLSEAREAYARAQEGVRGKIALRVTKY
jgi:NADPH:quinone reductase-like Zn-dependent oxidoreductase